MSKHAIEYYFDTKNFQHTTIFDNCIYPWQVISKITMYLSAYPFSSVDTSKYPGVTFVNPESIQIGYKTSIEPGAYISGPCIIGNSCEVRHGAYIRGNVITGDECVIGHVTEMKNVLFMNNTKAGHFSYIADSVVGNNVNFGAGSKCANLRLDKQTIKVQFENSVIETQLKKFSAIIGDNCELGCNVVLNPGTVLGKHVYIYPTLSVFGTHESFTTLQTATQIISKKQSK